MRKLYVLIIVIYYAVDGHSQYWTGNGTSIFSNNAGNVGIGTGSPIYKLHSVSQGNTIAASALLHGQYYGAAITSESNSSSHYTFLVGSGGNSEGSNSITRFLVRADGNVGIGTNAPSSKLHLLGSASENTFLTIQRTNNANGVYTTYVPSGSSSNMSPTWMVGMREGGRSDYSISTWDGSIATDRFRIGVDGRVGIGSALPNAAFDVSADISNGRLGTVFGRLPEGNNTGSGTFLGVRGYETQAGNYNNKSFAIEHNFYGETNSSINFYRGGSLTGGYLTFNTDQNIERLRITSDGKVGIGKFAPQEALDVNGNTVSKGFILKDNSDNVLQSHDQGAIHQVIGTYRMWDPKAVFIAAYNAGTPDWATATERVFIGNPFKNDRFLSVNLLNGKVGIGATNTNEGDYRLYVEKGIRTRKVKVDVTSWADYVFDPTYRLPALYEVEAFIKQHKHLPEVPSATEVAQNGLDLGGNQAVLLKKIEELTLYVLQLNRKLEQQEADCTRR